MTDNTTQSRLEGVAMVLGALALILALASVWQSATNRTMQTRVAEGQARLAKAQTLANLDNSLVQLMAKAVAEKNDGALRDLLGRNGVTFKSPPVAPVDTTNADVSKAEPGQ